MANENTGTTQGLRSVKLLQSAKAATAHQKEWFFDMKKRVENGAPFAYIDGVPGLLLQSMGIETVSSPWWSAICSAKQQSAKYFGLLRENGYRDDLCSYCATALACSMDPTHAAAAWGGLPTPNIVAAAALCDSTAKIFELVAKQYGAKLYLMEGNVQLRTPERWWERVVYNWEDFFDKRSLDEVSRELRDMIARLEDDTGHMLDMNELRNRMNRMNEQQTYYMKIRDLIAKTRPAPVSIADTVNSVMLAQWHQGTQWAVDHAKGFYEEIKSLVDQGFAACPNERIRLMWIGRGLWFNVGFYQYFEEKYGAVFVWSMYLAMGADAHARFHVDEDPIRALAAKEALHTDCLHMPPWNTDWFVNQAQLNGIDGVIYLVPENCILNVEGSYFTERALEKAGIPVLKLRADPVDARKWNQETMTKAVSEFIENRIIPKQAKIIG